MALTALEELTLRIWGMSLTFGGAVVCCLAVFEWIFKFRKTLRPNKLLLLIGSCFFGAMFLCASVYRILTLQINTTTFSLAFMSSIFLEVSQAILWRCLIQRLQSVLNSSRFGPKHVKIATCAAFTYCFVLIIFMVVGGVQSKANVIMLIRNKYYNQWFRGGDGIGLGIYGLVSFTTDMFLLATLRKNMKARRDRSKSDKSLKIKMQSILVIANLMFKVVDFSVKIASLATSYVPIDTYFRSFNVCFETWTLLKLGVTLEEVMRGDNVDPMNPPSATHHNSSERNLPSDRNLPRLESVSKGGDRTLDRSVNVDRSNAFLSPSMS
ncbi:hypothetical protein DFS34DRAFT_689074 [Phlyctochytrium arcticum]|nr:hypothetical protein DFS34DRAFT_689074 [Phlyctochytrium arcticum]